MKRSTRSLSIREMQIKTALRYHLVPVGMAIIKIAIKKKDDTWWCGCRENRILGYYWWECRLVQPLWKPVWKFFQKLNKNSLMTQKSLCKFLFKSESGTLFLSFQRWVFAREISTENISHYATSICGKRIKTEIQRYAQFLFLFLSSPRAWKEVRPLPWFQTLEKLLHNH